MAKLNWLILACLCLSLLPGCGHSEYEAEQVLLDSADEELEEMGEFLKIIDAREVQERYTRMAENDSLFRTQFADTVTLELSQALDLYKGILKIYEIYLDHHRELETEHAALDKQLEDLRHTLLKGSMTKQDFRIYYDRELADIEKLEENTEAIAKKVIEVEPNYKRVSPVVDSVCTRLRR